MKRVHSLCTRQCATWASTLQNAVVDTSVCFSPNRSLPALARSLLILPSDAVHWAAAAEAFSRRTPEVTISEAFTQTIANQLLVLRAFLHWHGPAVPAVTATVKKLSLFLVNDKALPQELRKLPIEEVEALHTVPLLQFRRHVAEELLRRYRENQHLSPALYSLRTALYGQQTPELDAAVQSVAEKGDKDTAAFCAKYTMRYLDQRPLKPLGTLRPKLWDAPNVLQCWAESQKSDCPDAEFVLRIGLRQATPLELVRAASEAPPRWEQLFRDALLAAWPQVSSKLGTFPVDDLPHVVKQYWNVEGCSKKILEVLGARISEMRFATLLECLIPLEVSHHGFDKRIQTFFQSPPECMDVVERELDLPVAKKFALLVTLAERGFTSDHWLMDRILSDVEKTLQATPLRPNVDEFILRACRHLPVFANHTLATRHILDTVSAKRWTQEEASSAALTDSLAALGACTEEMVPREILANAVYTIVEQVKRKERELSAIDWERLCSTPFLYYGTQVMPKLFPLLVNDNPPPISMFSANGVCTVLERLRDWSANGGTYEYQQSFPRMGPLLAVQRQLDLAMDKYKWNFPQLESLMQSLAKLEWCDPYTVKGLCHQAMCVEQEPQVPIHSMLSIVDSLRQMAVFHGPLLERFVQWYTWYVSSVRHDELKPEEIDSMAILARNLARLNFKSLEFAKTVAIQLEDRRSATPVQKLRLLTQLARFGYFPPEFRQGLKSVIEASKLQIHPLDDDTFADLTSEEWADAYYLHLCTYFDGPERLRQWITTDPDAIHFMKGDPAHYWFEQKRAEGRSFKALRIARSLKESLALILGENVLVPGHEDENFVYYVNFIDPREPTGNVKPLAVVVVPPENEFKVCVPLVGRQAEREMFDGVVNKVRHLRFMRYRVVVLYGSEWASLRAEKRMPYLANLLEDVK